MHWLSLLSVSFKRKSNADAALSQHPDNQRAGNGDRTRDPQLGKLMLYQLSYSRIETANI